MTTNGQDENDTAASSVRRIGRDEPRPLPKRFYKDVTVVTEGEAFAVALDGRLARTPAKNRLAVPVRALAEAVADEWRAQGGNIDPATMPLTTLTCTALDAVTGREHAVGADLARYFGSDLLCYRAENPSALVARQAAAWDPLVAWAAETLGVPFAVTTGLMPVAQSPDIVPRATAMVSSENAFRLAALHVLTTMMGSGILALAVARGRLSLPEAWAAAHLDEDWQIEQWGEDEEATARRRRRLLEARAAASVLEHVRGYVRGCRIRRPVAQALASPGSG